MRPYRTALIAIVALVIGFFLARAMFRCPKPESVALPKPVHTDEVIAWEPPDPRLGSLQLIIPGKLCQPSGGSYNQLRDEWSVTVDRRVTCPIKPQPNTSAPITYRYKYNFKKEGRTSASRVVKAPGVANAAMGQESSTVQIIDIVGSCDGCDRLTPKGMADTPIVPPLPDEEVKCVNKTPVLIDTDGAFPKDLPVPLGVQRVTWMAQGGEGYPTISAPATLCSNIGQDPNSQKAWCDINDDARDGKPHPYSVSLSACNNNTAAEYTMTLASPPSQQTKHK